MINNSYLAVNKYKEDIMQKLVSKLNADSWKEHTFMGLTILKIIKNNEVIKEYKTIYEARNHLLKLQEI